MPPSSLSLRKVAALAGVSVMTASRVLSGKAHVVPAKRAAVEQAAAKLGYRTNPMLRTVMSELRRGRGLGVTATLAFLNTGNSADDWRSYPYLRPTWEGARDRARELGFGFDDVWIKARGWSAKRSFAVLRARGIRGLLVPPGSSPEHLAFPLDDLALASFGGLAFDLAVHQVLPDYFHNYAECYRQLHSLGYRRIGLFTPDYERRQGHDGSVGGFLAAQWNLPGRRKVSIGTGSPNWASSEAAFKAWVQREKPDAVIANFNLAEQWLLEVGLKIPADIGLAHPGLAGDVEGWSGLDTLRRAQGEQAVDLLVAQILRNERGLPSLAKNLIIKGRWIDGRTTRLRQA